MILKDISYNLFQLKMEKSKKAFNDRVVIHLAIAICIMLLPNHLTTAANCAASDISMATLSAANAAKLYAQNTASGTEDYTGGVGFSFMYDVTNSDCEIKDCKLRK